MLPCRDLADIPTYFLFSTVHGDGDPSLRRFGSHHPWITRLSVYEASGLSLAAGTKIVGMLSGAEAEIIRHTAPLGGRATLYLDGGNPSVTVGVPILGPTHPVPISVEASGGSTVSVTASTRTFTTTGTWVNTPKPRDTIRVAGFVNAGNNGSLIVESATSNTIVVHDRNTGLVNESGVDAVITGYPTMQFIEGEHFATTAAPTTVLGRIGHQSGTRMQEFWRNWNEDAASLYLQTRGELLVGGFDVILQGAFDQYLYRKNDRDSFGIVQQGASGVVYWDSAIDQDSSTVIIASSTLVSFTNATDTIALASGSWTTTPTPGSRVIIAGSASNDGTKYVESATSNTIVVAEAGSLTDESAGASVSLNEETYGRFVVYHPHIGLSFDHQHNAGDPNDPNALGLVGTSGSNHQNSYEGGLGWDVGIINWLKRKHAGESFAVFKFTGPNDATNGDLQDGGTWRPGGKNFEQAKAMWQRAWRRAKNQTPGGVLGEISGNRWDVRGFFAWVGNSDLLKFPADLTVAATDVSPKCATWVDEVRSAFAGFWNNGTQTSAGATTYPFVFVKPHSRSYDSNPLTSQSSIHSSWAIGGIKAAMLSVPASNFAAQSLRAAIDDALDNKTNVLAIDPNKIGTADEVFGMDSFAFGDTISRAWHHTEFYIEQVPQAIRAAYESWEGTPVTVISASPSMALFLAFGQSQLGTWLSNETLKFALDSEYLITDVVDPAYTNRVVETRDEYQMWNADKLVMENFDVLLNTNTGQNITVISGSTLVSVDGPTKTYSLSTGVWPNTPNVGSEIVWSGFTDPSNNGVKTVTAATSTSITVSETVVTEAAGDTVTCISNQDDPITNFPSGNWGPESGMYPELFDALGIPVGLLKSAVSSASLTLQADPRGVAPSSGVWDPDADNLYLRMLNQWGRMRSHLCSLGITPDLQGVFYFQGFTDISSGVPQSTYQSALLRLIDKVREDFRTRATGPHPPFCVMQSPLYYKQVNGVSAANVDQIRAAQAAAVASRANCVLVNSDTLEGQVRATGTLAGQVDVHLDAESIIEAGRLFGKAWRAAAGA